MTMSPMEMFFNEAPEVAKAFQNLITAVASSPGLDGKTKQLIYIAMKAASGDAGAVRAHIPMAKQMGATKEEVVDAVLMSLTVSGIRGVITCLPEVIQCYSDSSE